MFGPIRPALTPLDDGRPTFGVRPSSFADMVHPRRAIIVYRFTPPSALVGAFGWATVFASLGGTYTQFAIEEIGVE